MKPAFCFQSSLRTALAATGIALLAVVGPLDGAELRLASGTASGEDTASWDARLASMTRAGQLRLERRRTDPLVPGVVHERFVQLHHGVTVWGAAVARQRRADGSVSVFGTLHEGIEVDATPRLSAEAAREIALAHTGAAGARAPELVVLPREDGSYALVWRLRAALPGDVRMVFVDAGSGAIVDEYSDLRTQSVGSGSGVLGDRKKISTRPSGGGFVADDLLRPPALRTYDMDGNLFRTLFFLNGRVNLDDSDLARDDDDDWDDPVTLDAHVYAGWTYDYLFKRFGRRGLDDANIAIRSITHPVALSDYFFYAATDPLVAAIFYGNAFYYGEGIMVYGVGLPPGVTSGGQQVRSLAGALDVVAHELAHGITDYTSGLIYRNESGALNESFSDIVAVGTEFFFQTPGNGPGQADYLLGEDVFVPGGVRSLSNPAVFGDPDHYSIRFLGSRDNGGVHINSGISNHAFYLAIEGGTNRTSGLGVQGVGGSRRHEIEQAFYRAFAFLLTPNANFAAARNATIQSARDVFGAGSDAERAITEAWTAVGVQ